MSLPNVLVVSDSDILKLAIELLLRHLGFPPAVSVGSNLGVNCKPVVMLVNRPAVTQGRDQLKVCIKQHCSKGPVLVLVRDYDERDIEPALAGGASGILTQSAPLRDLRRALILLSEGKTWYEAEVFKHLQRLPAIQANPHWYSLTNRDREIVKWIGGGKTNKEIASHFGVTEQCIKTCVSNLLRKTRASNRSQLVVEAMRAGLVECDIERTSESIDM